MASRFHSKLSLIVTLIDCKNLRRITKSRADEQDTETLQRFLEMPNLSHFYSHCFINLYWCEVNYRIVFFRPKILFKEMYVRRMVWLVLRYFWVIERRFWVIEPTAFLRQGCLFNSI